ncbi:excalibur calcium-binding domain-containing protein [Agromyces sp. CF514]|uniref:excalibur calcium-binding domain-containing protein n=1 Tax=Agromyces sp. CF514 TaxID=1881031 RepID=UPI000B82ECEE|nr:excalibur calcium-binding domain-containing protein [Agromyces sp. CF514]
MQTADYLTACGVGVSAPAPYYQNCDAVRAAGAAPIHPGDPGWQSKFDRDGDGIGCDT